MNVETIQVDAQTARRHYSIYLKAARRHRAAREARRLERAQQIHKELYRVRVEKTQLEREDEMLLQGYRELVRGKQIIDIHQVVGKAGLNERKLPRLAVMRADHQRCRITVRGPDYLKFQSPRESWKSENYTEIKLADQRMYAELFDSSWRKSNGYNQLHEVEALVPTIPPHLRPDVLKDYYILWEAEWKRAAPVDPMLLSKINDRFYTVVAQWDLTPLERSVLEGRL